MASSTARPIDGPTSLLPDADALRTDAHAVMSEAQDVAGKIAGEANAQLSQLTEIAKDQVSEVTEKAKGFATEQKDLLTRQVEDVTSVAARVASELEQQQSSGASYARYFADNVGKVRDQIRDNDVDQVLAMAQDYGRKQPAAFIGAAALLGFAASRFLLASAHRKPADAAMPTSPASPPFNGSAGPAASGRP